MGNVTAMELLGPGLQRGRLIIPAFLNCEPELDALLQIRVASNPRSKTSWY
jgi:hypothetical protein